MIKKVVLLAAFAMLLPCLAMAGGVSFTTSGTFSNPSLFPITFTGASYTNTDGGNLSFGTFDLSACTTGKCNGTESFTLHIDVTSPNPGGGDLDATLFGVITRKGKSTIVISFTRATVTIGTITFSIPAITETINGLGVTTLNGNVVVPEASAQLLLGFGALGLMAFATISRKMVRV